MNTFKTAFLLIAAIGVFSLCIADINPKEAVLPNKIQWHSIEALEDLSTDSDKKIIVDIYTDWCRPCKMMDSKTFKDESLIQHLNKNFHMVKFNAENKEAIDFKGQSYSFVKKGRRGYHELAAQLTKGRLSYPSFVVLNADLEIEKIIVGYKDADTFKSMTAKINS